MWREEAIVMLLVVATVTATETATTVEIETLADPDPLQELLLLGDLLARSSTSKTYQSNYLMRFPVNALILSHTECLFRS